MRRHENEGLVSLKDDIIHIIPPRNLSGSSARNLFTRTMIFASNLRKDHKQVRIAVDLGLTEVIESTVRVQVRRLIADFPYDKIAFYGVKSSSIKLFAFALAIVSKKDRVAILRSEQAALKWLRHNPHRQKTTLRIWSRGIGISIATILTIVLAFWYVVGIPNILKIPDDFSYDAVVIAHDDYYNEQIGQFGGDSTSNADYYYRTSVIKDDIINVKNVFNTNHYGGDPSVERNYGIDAKTGQNVKGYGDRDREGYVFAPRHLNKQDFTYWYVDNDTPATMKFQAVEDVLGLKTYRYEADYRADKTKELGNLPDIGKTRGIDEDVKLQLWIEPTTGHLVKYDDLSKAYYYDLATGMRTAPWAKFHDEFSFDSIVKQVGVAQSAMQKAVIVENAAPLFCVLIILMITTWLVLTMWFRKYFTGTRSFARLLALITTWISLSSLIFWSFGSETSLPDVMVPSQPGTALVLLILSFVIWVLIRRTPLSREWRIVCGVILTSVIIWSSIIWLYGLFGIGVNINALELPGGVVRLMTPLSGFSLTLLLIVMLLRLLPVHRIKTYLGEGLALIVGGISIVSLLGFAYGTSTPWLQVLHEARLLTSITLLFLVVSVFASERSWLTSKKLRQLGKSWMLFAAILFGSLMFTGFAWQFRVSNVAQENEVRFHGDVKVIQDKISSELNKNVALLRGSQSLFFVDENVTQVEWGHYASTIHLSQDYSSTQAVGFAVQVPKQQVGAYTTKIRAEGQPKFAIHPTSPDRNNYVSVLYVEPFKTRQQYLGYDLSSSPLQEMTMAQARDTGSVSLSRQDILVNETDLARNGFIMYIPIYKNGAPIATISQRQAALIGYVFSPISIDNFIKTVVGEVANGIEFEIYDTGDSSNLTGEDRIFASTVTPVTDASFTLIQQMTAIDHTWTIRYTGLSTYTSGVVINSPTIVLAIGLVFSVLLAVAVYGQVSSRRRSIVYASELTADLSSERARAVLQQQRDEAILAGINEGLIVFDKSGKIDRINDAAQRMFGYTESELVGKNFEKVLIALKENGQIMPYNQRPATRALNGGKEILEDMLQYRSKDGRIFSAQLSVAPIYHRGKVIGAIEIFRDITKERELDKSKDEFLSLASHQLRTPLSATKWFLEGLLTEDIAGKLTIRQTELVQKVSDSNDRMIQLVSSLLYASRVNAGGKIAVTPAPMDLSKLMMHMMEDMQPELSIKDQHIVLEMPDDLPIIMADESVVRQIIQSLIVNSSKYSVNKKDIFVAIKQRQDDLLFTVRDEGFGITATQQNRVFKKYFRAKNISGQAITGNGLGLYQVKKLVDQSGGRIWFESTENVGTSFHFTLPLKNSTKKESK